MMHPEINQTLQRRLADLTECFDAPCVVNAPRVAQEVLGRTAVVTAFTDEAEYASLPGFRRWSIGQPVYVADEFDFVLLFAADRRPAEVFAALRVLTHFHFDTPVVVVAPDSHTPRLVAALERFDVTNREVVGDWALLANFDLP